MANECNANSICEHMFMLLRVHFTLIMIVLISLNINNDDSKLFTTALKIDYYSHPDYYYKSSSSPTTRTTTTTTTTTTVPRKEQRYQRHHQTAYEINMNDLQQPLTRRTSGKKSSNKENLPQEQKLALQIFITDPSNHGRKSSGVQHRKHSNILIGKKRPYDIVQEDTILSNNHHHHHHLKNYTPSERHFYMLSPINPPPSSSTGSTSNSNNNDSNNNSSIASNTNNSSISSTSNSNNKTVSLNDSKNNLQDPPLLKVLASDDQREVSSRKPILNNRIELVRTQHRPPWRKKPPSQSILLYIPVKTLDPTSSSSSSSLSSLEPSTTSTTTAAPKTSTTTPRSIKLEHEPTSYLFGIDSDSLTNRRMPHRTSSTTTTAPITTSTTTTTTTFPPTTEFYKLISSAHSPIDTANESLNYIPRRRINGKPFGANSMDYHSAYDSFHDYHKIDGPANRIRAGEQPVTTTSTTPTTTYPTRTQTRLRPTAPMSLSLSSSSSSLNMSDGHAVSPEILVGGSNEDIGSLKKRGNLVRINGINRNGEDVSRPSLDFSPTLDEVPLTVFDGKRKVTIIRHSTKSQQQQLPSQILIRKATTTTQPPAITTTFQSGSNFSQQQIENLINQIPSNIRIKNEESFLSNLNTSSSSMPTNQLVRMISKHKNKYDDNVKSNTLTVVDNDAIRLPPNATSVHNKLIVAIRPGRPRRYPSTTQFPVYNIVAGITPPSIPIPTNNHTQSPFVRPNSPEGSVFGLLKPDATGTATTTQQPSSSSSSFGAQNIKFPAPLPSQLQPVHVEIQEKLNISVPDSANILGPHKIPDKILMETDEQHERPPDALVISDATIVSRPYGSNTVINQDGIMKLGTTTTRRPTRNYTTKRINIVASNTTVVHQFNHPTHQQNTLMRPPPPTKPSFLVHLGNIFNAGITTSAIAILTLVKTIFTIILVMFLPPIALTAAITQAIALG